MAKTKTEIPELSTFRQSGHLYEVYNDKDIRVFFTDSPEAVDNADKIKDLLDSNHKFKINGKAIPKTKIIAEAKKVATQK